MQSLQAVCFEVGDPGEVGFDLCADSLHAIEQDSPVAADACGVGWDQAQVRAAGQRLAEAHAAGDPERLGRSGDLPHDLLAACLRR